MDGGKRTSAGADIAGMLSQVLASKAERERHCVVCMGECVHGCEEIEVGMTGTQSRYKRVKRRCLRGRSHRHPRKKENGVARGLVLLWHHC